MKKLFFMEIILVAIFLLGCQNNSNEEMYTVWTDISTATEFQQTFHTALNDGNYITVEFSNSQFSQMTSFLTTANDYKHNWTEEELKKYFVGRGFDSEIASKTVAWLVTVNHGLVASRSGNIVYYILR